MSSFPGDVFDDSSFDASAAASVAPAGSWEAARVSLHLAQEDVVRNQEQAGAAQIRSIHLPRFVGSLPTVEQLSPMEDVHSPIFFVERSKDSVSELKLVNIPMIQLSFIWRRIAKLRCAQVEVILRKQCDGQKKSRCPKYEMPNSVDDLESSRSIFGSICPKFETLDARDDFRTEGIYLSRTRTSKKKVHLEEQNGSKE